MYTVSGQQCVAQSTINDIWYRATVLEVHEVEKMGEKTVLVFYVDYGRKETLSYHRLRKVKDTFLELPAQVNDFELSFHYPRVWIEAISLLQMSFKS